jgi:RNA polymerase-binding transcription factor DksA
MNIVDKELVAHNIEERVKRLEVIIQGGKVIDDNRAAKALKEDESARLDSLAQQPIDDALLNLARLELSELKYNLDKFESEEAGGCEECSSEIPLKRLLAVPTTRKCVNCAAAGAA